MTRYVRLFWPSTLHAAYRTPFGEGIHAGLISTDGEELLEPLSSKVLRGGPLVPALSTWMPSMRGESKADLERHDQALNRLTFWRRDIEELSFERRGVVGELWGSLEVLLDYGEPVATRGLRSDSKLPYRLEFSLDGERFTTSAAYYYREPVVAEAHAPPPRRTLGSVLVGLRAALLYHYLPYDKSAFGRLQSPPSLLLQLLAVGPMWLRGPFFTLFLLLTLMDTPDEYTLMRFILGLKSSQVLTGVLLAISGLVQFFECAVVADPPDCGADAPGVRDHWLVDAAFYVWLQLLTLAAFAMLPSAVGVDRHSPVTSRRAAVAPVSEEVAPPPSPPPSPPHDASTPGARAAGVGEFGSLDGTPLLELPHMGARALGERRASSDAALATTDGAVDATPPRRSSYDSRAASQRPRRKFNLRFVALVKWDLACFLCSLLLFLAAVVHAAPSWESLLHSAEPWTDWRAACAFYICIRVIFALTAFPFALFEVPGLSSLLAWTQASGYAPDGRLVAEDVGGFSAYVAWLEGFVSSRAARRHLGGRELQLLQRAAAAARRHLRRTPHEGKRLGRRRIEELEGLLTSLVPPKSLLFGTVFPDKMLCNQYKQRLAQAQGDPAAGVAFESGATGASTHEAKYGVEWESDAASTQCRLCGGKWGLLRRRHHCRACGQLVCDDCSRSRINVPGSDNLKRSCDLCTAARRDEPECEPTDGPVYRGGENSKTFRDEPRRDSEANDVDPNQARLRELL